MSELAVSTLRLGYLLLLWLFVFASLAALRRDVYGLTVTRRKSRSRRLGRGRVVVAPPSGFAHHTSARGAPAPGSDTPTKVTVMSGPLRGTALPLGSGIVIGRSSTANLVLDDEYTSGRHAQIMPDSDGWIVEDLGSTNGTFLGRERVLGQVRVHAGQHIRIGRTRLDLTRS